MSFQRKDAVDGRAIGANTAKADGRAQNGNRAGFRTDSSISNNRPAGERTLQRWVPDANPQDVDASLEKPSGSGHWDQFAENERRFGVKTTYNENYYTTAIDKSHPQYAQRMAAAEKTAREIERTVPTTSHVAEERVMDFAGGNDQGGDEEDKYSGVRRQDSTLQPSRDNKYTPPARRAPTGQATVSGAPVDPAIISAQIKGPPTKKQPAVKAEESKSQGAASDAAASATPKADNKAPEAKSESKAAVKTGGVSSETNLAGSNSADSTSAEKALRPSASTSRNISPQGKEAAAPNATAGTATGGGANASATVEKELLKHFKDFASKQRVQADKMRSNKLKADNQVKLQELKKFADNFKLSTPVPSDLISIIAKDPDKRKRIQEKALQNVDDVQRSKGGSVKDKEVGTADSLPKPPTPQAAGPAPIPAGTDSRANARANAPQHTPSPSGVANRHPGPRQPYGPQYNQQQFRNDRSGPQQAQGRGAGTGGLADRLRKVEQDRFSRNATQHQQQFQEMRLPPTGPANSIDANYGRRLSGNPVSHVKLNPNSHEFRPFTAPFNPSAGSSPRSAVNHVERPASSPQVGQLIQRKSKTIDVKKCMILSSIKAFVPPPQGRNFDDNNGLRPSYDTLPTWRQPQEEEKPDSTMHLTYKEYFERMPFAGASMATPNPPHALPQQLAHQHQLPFHLQHGAHALPRQSPHMPTMQMHGNQHGHAPQVSFNNTDDHRMMHSNSAQSYASPRMAQVPIYPQQVNPPAQMPYNQPGMPQFMPSTPQMNQYRAFSSSPQYMPQQTPPMAMPMMAQQFVGPPNTMMPSGPQMPMFPGGHPQYMAPGAVAPQQMPGTNGFPSPVRPAAVPMMVQQGSQQGQPMYGISPNMQFQQPIFAPQQQQPGQPMNMRGYSNPGPQQYGTSPQQMHQYGGPQQHRNGSNNFNKNFQGHNQHQGPQAHAIPAGGPGRTPDGPDEAK